MVIDCDACTARGPACGDCVITVLMGAPPGAVEIDDGERAALAVLADGGLVPPLRLVEPEPTDQPSRPSRPARSPRPDEPPRRRARGA